MFTRFLVLFSMLAVVALIIIGLEVLLLGQRNYTTINNAAATAAQHDTQVYDCRLLQAIAAHDHITLPGVCR